MATVTCLASRLTAMSYGANSLDYLNRFRMCSILSFRVPHNDLTNYLEPMAPNWGGSRSASLE